ncbi:MAG: DNA alkylation repair protein [Chloroflexi bacterium]|nr:DNA alkylation repair protein [Chloroflexota bacterium]
MQSNEIIQKIKSLANPENVEGMARFGINPTNTYGVSIPNLRKMARETGKDHELALELWASGIHEARLLACLIERPDMVTGEQLESWVKGFDSWDVCDICCGHLFDRTAVAYRKAQEWSEREEEFVRRAGFVLMAALSVHDKKASDEDFAGFLPMIKKHATDERNYVKKAVNWALRQIGKRNWNLNEMAIKTAEEIKQLDSKSARWIASDAIRELTGEKVQKKLASIR